MSATGFHPEPSAKAPWTRTMVLTAAYAGDDAAKAAPVSRARIKRFARTVRRLGSDVVIGSSLLADVCSKKYRESPCALIVLVCCVLSLLALVLRRETCPHAGARDRGALAMRLTELARRGPKHIAKMSGQMTLI